MKTVFILPYFGKFPNYFGLYLKSIKYNKEFDWLLITDDKSDYDFPDNLKIIYKSFVEIQQLFQSKFDFKINLERPHKLCDYKPAFGYVFQDFISDYDYWGHCDSDVIFGNLNNYISEPQKMNFDKIFVLGHLSLYANNDSNNKRFMLKNEGNYRYKEVFSIPIGTLFDEKFYKSINCIFKENNFKLYSKNYAADISPYYYNFRLSLYEQETNSYVLDSVKKQIFTWEDGTIYRYYKLGNKIIKEDFLYIHLQKRVMKINLDVSKYSKILITPNKFLPLEAEITLDNFNKFYKKKWFNRQYFKVKWNSFKYKLKYLDYFYGSKKNI